MNAERGNPQTVTDFTLYCKSDFRLFIYGLHLNERGFILHQSLEGDMYREDVKGKRDIQKCI